MDWNELKEIIDAHENSYPDLSWQKTVFEMLAAEFSVIPIEHGVYQGTTEEEIEAEKRVRDLKAPQKGFTGWEQYSYTPRRHIVPEGDKIGIVTGPASGLLVLDVDDLDAFRKFCARHGIDMEVQTLTIQSREGRYHLYFRYPDDGREYRCRNHKDGKDSEGFDVRGARGYVLGPGSLHPVTRKPYTIISAEPIAEAPEWLKNWSLYRSVTLPDTPAPEEMPVASMTAAGQSSAMHPTPITGPAAAPALPGNIQTMLNGYFPMGERSEPLMSVILSMLNAGVPPDQVSSLVMSMPIGEVARQKGEAWLNYNIAKAQQYIAQFPATPPQKKSKLIMSNELYDTMLEHEYFVHRQTEEYYAKIVTSSGEIRYYNIQDNRYEGHILNKQAAKTVQTGGPNDMRTAKKRLADHVGEHAKPIEQIRRIGRIGEKLILDLGRSTGECICISKDGYALTSRPQALFDERGTLEPIENIKLGCTGLDAANRMFDLLGITDSNDRWYLHMLLVSWLFPNISSPIFFLVGGYGTGKTTLGAALKGTFDPEPEDESGGANMPENVQDLAILVYEKAVSLIDNFTSLPVRIQNALSQTFSRGYYIKKKLYSNAQSIKIPLQSSVILTSLDVPKNLKEDLASRMAFFPMKPRTTFMAEMDMKKALDELYPTVRGEYCWLAAEILKRIDQYKPLSKKRHADFDKLFQAGLAAMGIADPEQEYRKILKTRIARDSEVLLKTRDTLMLIVDEVKEQGMFACSMEDFHRLITQRNATGTYIPSNAAALGKYLVANKSILNGMGIEIIEGSKIHSGRLQLHLFATEEKLVELAGPDAKVKIQNQPGIISIIYDAPPDQINKLVDGMLNLRSEDAPMSASESIESAPEAPEVSASEPVKTKPRNPFLPQ